MADVVSKVCDLCRQDQAVPIEICFPEGTLHVDLCEAHRQPVEDLRTQAPEALFLLKGQRRRQQRVVVNDDAI